MKHLFIFIIIIFFVACAQQNQPLSGGPKDTIPPKIKQSIPSIDDTNFTKNEIIITNKNEIIIICVTISVISLFADSFI